MQTACLLSWIKSPMPAFFLDSKDNPKIKHLRGLIDQTSYRKKNRQTVLEGTH